jgi:metal-responsive CopG/Arc/MetJ family transcriptional regulator
MENLRTLLSHVEGGKEMKRRSKTKFTQIHVSIPVRVLEDLDDTLDFKQSRSKVITKLVMNYLEGDQIYIGSMLKKEIVAFLMNQIDSESAEYVLLQSLLQVFSQ